MSVPSALSFLDAVSGFTRSAGGGASADRPIRLAEVDPAYDPFDDWPDAAPPARVTFEGETILSSKAYAVADGFLPIPGQRVWLVPIGNSYLIGGSIGGQHNQGFWQDPSTGDAGLEMGGGSYFSTDEGLVLAHDAAIAGELTVGSDALRVPEIQTGTHLATFASVSGAASVTQNILFPVAWPVGTTVIMPNPNINSAAGATTNVVLRAYNISPTGFTMLYFCADVAAAARAWTNVPCQWTAFGYTP